MAGELYLKVLFGYCYSSLKWTRSQLFLRSRMLMQNRRVNAWNAFVRAKLQDANDGLEKGERIKLTNFIAENKAGLLRAYGQLTVAEKRVYNAQVLQARQEKSSAARANPKAVWHDMNATFTSMDHEVGAACSLVICLHSLHWTALCARMGMECFYIAVRGGIEDLSELKIFFTKKAQKFVSSILRVEPRHLGLKLEVFVVGKLSTNNSRPLNKLIAECRELIQDGLGFILLEQNDLHKMKMNYRNYECAIVEHCGVALINWPLSGVVQNPSKIGGRNQVQTLLDALQSNQCKWVSLSEEELSQRMTDNRARQACSEVVYIPRKQRTAPTAKKSAKVIIDSSESSSDESIG
ncbi:hypothetical protein EV702DRAFT_980156 [Suillus placidus]|uniref:Uncharacterized protein n=1 Tax=Suillus placidus TaxID=48579 RepID=A0A9P6ZIE7_9AGAM|nr:hypothetical protein EV702DRAFT_980156 [Suillus placidus]